MPAVHHGSQPVGEKDRPPEFYSWHIPSQAWAESAALEAARNATSAVDEVDWPLKGYSGHDLPPHSEEAAGAGTAAVVSKAPEPRCPQRDLNRATRYRLIVMREQRDGTGVVLGSRRCFRSGARELVLL